MAMAAEVVLCIARPLHNPHTVTAPQRNARGIMRDGAGGAVKEESCFF
jgi:hypothetical protein